MYKATYKCRMCGETFADGETGSEKIANFAVVQIAVSGMTNSNLGNPVSEKTSHDCPDGSIGYADFVGFRKENV